MRPARSILLATLAVAAIARAQSTAPATLPSPPAAGAFDPSSFPRNGDLSLLTPDQRRTVLTLRQQALRALADVRRAMRRPPATATAPTTLPVDVAATVAQLADRDPVARAAARSALMSLDAADLPALRDALAGQTLGVSQANALRDAVEQVFLVDKHRFTGDAPSGGKLGISVCTSENDVPIVGGRMPGWDGYRAFEDGDAILAIRPPVGSGPARRPGETFVPTQSLRALLGTLAVTRPGDHVVVRLLRNGLPIEVDVRVAMAMDPVLPDGVLRNRFAAEADNFWRTQFAGKLRIATPATRPVQ